MARYSSDADLWCANTTRLGAGCEFHLCDTSARMLEATRRIIEVTAPDSGVTEV